MLHIKQLMNATPWLQVAVITLVMTGLFFQPAVAETEKEEKETTGQAVSEEKASENEAAEQSAESAQEERDVPTITIDKHPDIQYDPTMPLTWEEVIVRSHKFAVASTDGRHRFGVRGRLQTDVAYNMYDSQDNVSRTEFGDNYNANFGTWHRRVRMGFLGVMYDRWEWQVEPEFRDTEIRFANLYMAYLFDHGRLAVGHFKEPFSLESHTSSRRITFLERASPVDALRPNSSRSIGLMYETLQPGWYLAGGLFGGNTYGAAERSRDINEGWAATFRGSIAPYEDKEAGIYTHIGLSFQHRVNAFAEGDDLSVDGEGRIPLKGYVPVRKRTRGGQRAAETRFTSTNDLEGIENHQTYAVEAAFGFNRLSVQGEYLLANFNRPDDLGEYNFQGEEGEGEIDNLEWLNHYDRTVTQDGWYVEGTFFLTRDRRTYRAFSGDFGKQYVNNPVSEGGAGAWALAARYAFINGYTDQYARNEDGSIAVGEDLFEGDVYAGGQKLEQFTLGMNWFPESDIVVKLNVIYNDGRYQMPVLNLDGNPEVKSTDGFTFALRFQYEW